VKDKQGWSRLWLTRPEGAREHLPHLHVWKLRISVFLDRERPQHAAENGDPKRQRGTNGRNRKPEASARDELQKSETRSVSEG
jgi:hypothetical protein